MLEHIWLVLANTKVVHSHEQHKEQRSIGADVVHYSKDNHPFIPSTGNTEIVYQICNSTIADNCLGLNLEEYQGDNPICHLASDNWRLDLTDCCCQQTCPDS